MMETSCHFLQVFIFLKTTIKWTVWETVPMQEGVPERLRVHLPKDLPPLILKEIRGFKRDDEALRHVTFHWGDNEHDMFSKQCKGPGHYQKIVADELEKTLVPLLHDEITGKCPSNSWPEFSLIQLYPSLTTLHPHLLNGGLYDLFPSSPIPWMPISVGTEYIVPRTHIGRGQYRPRLSVTMTPPGMYTRTHIDECVPNLVWQVVGIKLWMCWPGSPENAERWNHHMTDSRTLKWCFDNLTDLRVILMTPGREIIIPTGEYHAVLSLSPSIHFGMDHICSNSIAISLTHRRRHLKALHNLPPDYKGYRFVQSHIHELEQIMPNLFYKPFERNFPETWADAVEEAERIESKELFHQGVLKEEEEIAAQRVEEQEKEVSNVAGNGSSDMDMTE